MEFQNFLYVEREVMREGLEGEFQPRWLKLHCCCMITVNFYVEQNKEKDTPISALSSVCKALWGSRHLGTVSKSAECELDIIRNSQVVGKNLLVLPTTR